MGRVICVVNLRKNSGKTSTSVNLAASLAVLEKKTLFIDCSSDGKASCSFFQNRSEILFDLFDVLTGIVSARRAVLPTELSFLHVLPFGERQVNLYENLAMNADRDMILSIIVKKFLLEYDYVVIDTPPDDGLLLRSAVIAGNSLVIPLETGFSSLKEVDEILAFSGRIRKNKNEPLILSGILLNRSGERGFNDCIDEVGEFGELSRVFYPVSIPTSSARENPSEPVCLSNMKSPVAKAFFDFSYEFLQRDGR